MAEHTAIPWCDHTFNPWWGCENISPGCAHCYAERHAGRFSKGLWGPGHRFRFFEGEHWRQPLQWNARARREGVRKRVFCASMADVFEEREELEEYRERLFDVIEGTPTLDWLILTKRAEAMRDYFQEWDLPENTWLGVTIENARYTYRADILREIPAAVRFISAEPLLGSLVNPTWREIPLLPLSREEASLPLDLTEIDWLIAGAESGPKARPMDEKWVRELRDACLAPCDFCSGRIPVGPEFAGHACTTRRPAFFYKQEIVNGRKVECPELDGRVWNEFPANPLSKER